MAISEYDKYNTLNAELAGPIKPKATPKVNIPKKVNKYEALRQSGVETSVIGRDQSDVTPLDKGAVAGENIDETRAYHQSGLDQYMRGGLKGAGLVGTTVASTFTALPYGILKGTYEGLATDKTAGEAFSSVYDNEASRFLDDFNKGMEEKFPNYYSEKEQKADVFSTTNMLSPNFWGDKVIKNAGFTVGAIVGGKKVAQGMQWLGKLAMSGRYAQELTAMNTLISTGMKPAEAMRKVASGIRALDATTSLGASTIAAAGEGSMEALQVKDQLKKQLLDDYKSKSGQSIVPDDVAENIERTASAAGNTTFAANMAILTASDYFQFGKLFNKGFKQEATRVGKMALEDGVYNAVKPTLKSKILGAVKSGLGNSLAEAGEEGSQTFTQAASKDYYTRQFDRDGIDTKDNMLHSMVAGLGETFETREGLEGMLLGAITGIGSHSIISGVSRVVNRANPSEYEVTSKAANAINAANAKLQPFMDSIVRGASITKDKEAILKSNNPSKFLFGNIAHDEFKNIIQPYLETDRFDILEDRLNNQYDRDDITDMGTDTRKTSKQYVSNLITEAKRLRDSWDVVNTRFPNANYNAKVALWDTMTNISNSDNRAKELEAKIAQQTGIHYSIVTAAGKDYLTEVENAIDGGAVDADIEDAKDVERLLNQKRELVNRYKQLLTPEEQAKVANHVQKIITDAENKPKVEVPISADNAENTDNSSNTTDATSNPTEEAPLETPEATQSTEEGNPIADDVVESPEASNEESSPITGDRDLDAEADEWLEAYRQSIADGENSKEDVIAMLKEGLEDPEHDTDLLAKMIEKLEAPTEVVGEPESPIEEAPIEEPKAEEPASTPDEAVELAKTFTDSIDAGENSLEDVIKYLDDEIKDPTNDTEVLERIKQLVLDKYKQADDNPVSEGNDELDAKVEALVDEEQPTISEDDKVHSDYSEMDKMSETAFRSTADHQQAIDEGIWSVVRYQNFINNPNTSLSGLRLKIITRRRNLVVPDMGGNNTNMTKVEQSGAIGPTLSAGMKAANYKEVAEDINKNNRALARQRNPKETDTQWAAAIKDRENSTKDLEKVFGVPFKVMVGKLANGTDAVYITRADEDNTALYDKLLNKKQKAFEESRKAEGKEVNGILAVVVDENDNIIVADTSGEIMSSFKADEADSEYLLSSNIDNTLEGVLVTTLVSNANQKISGFNAVSYQHFGRTNGFGNKVTEKEALDPTTPVGAAWKSHVDELATSRQGMLDGSIKYLAITGSSSGVFQNTKASNELGETLSIDVNSDQLSFLVPKIEDIETPGETTIGANEGLTKEQRVKIGKPYLIYNGKLFPLQARKLIASEIGNVAKMFELAIANPSRAPYFLGKIKEIVYINKQTTTSILNGELAGDDLAEYLGSKYRQIDANKLVANPESAYQISSVTEKGVNPKKEKTSYRDFILVGDNRALSVNFNPHPTTIKDAPNYLNGYLTYKPIQDQVTTKVEIAKEPTTVEQVANTMTTKALTKAEKAAKLAALRAMSTEEEDNSSLKRLASLATTKTKENIDSARQWFSDRFNGESFEVVESLINGNAFGEYTAAATRIFNGAEEGTVYHEAFHKVTHEYLTPKQIASLYDAVRKNINSKFSDLEAEEWLAEAFRNYVLGGQKAIKNMPYTNNIFKRLYNWIKSLVTGKTTPEQVFRKLASKKGYTGAKKFNTQQFTKLERAIPGLTHAQTKNIVDSVNGHFFRRLFAANLTPDEILGSKGREYIDKIYSRVYQSLVNDYTREFGYFTDDIHTDDEWEAIDQHYRLMLDINEDDVPTGLNAVVIQAHKDYLKSIGIDIAAKIGLENKSTEDTSNEDDDDSDKTEEKNSDSEDRSRDSAYDRSSNEESSIHSAPNSIKLLVMSLPAVDANGEPEFNSIGGPKLNDYLNSMKLLYANLAGLSSFEDMHKKLVEISTRFPVFKQLISRLGEPGSNKSFEQFLLEQDFRQAFSKFESKGTITLINPETGQIYQVDANANKLKDRIKENWIGNLRGLANDPTSYIKKNDAGLLTIDQSFIDDARAKKFMGNSKALLAALGVTFTDLSQEQVQALPDIKNITNTIFKYVAKAVEEGKAVNDLFGKDADVKGQLDKLVEMEAPLSKEVVELSYISAEGKRIYAVSLNHYYSLTVNNINNATSRDQLFRDYPHLDNPYTKNSVWLKNLFDKNGNKIPGQKLFVNTVSGLKIQNQQDSGIGATKMEPSDKIVQEINDLLGHGTVSLIRAADKSSEYALGINSYGKGEHLAIPLELIENEGLANSNVHEIFLGYFNDELGRIRAFNKGVGKQFDIYNRQAMNFSLFADILSPETLSSIEPYKTNEEELDALLEAKISKEVTEYLEGYASDVKAYIQARKVGNEYEKGYTGINPEFTSKSLDAAIQTFAANHLVNMIEQSKLLIGDSAFYKDKIKRISAGTGTKKFAANSKLVNDWFNNFYKNKGARVDGKVANGRIKTVIFSDVKAALSNIEDYIDALEKSGMSKEDARSVLEAYAKWDEKEGKWLPNMDEGDAQGWITLDEYREFMMRIGGAYWTEKHEAQYRYEVALERGEEAGENPNFYFMPIKAQHFGPQVADNIYAPAFHKYSLAPLYHSLVKGRNMEKLLDSMRKNQVGYALFGSGSKVGTPVDSSGKLPAFYDENGELNGITADESTSEKTLFDKVDIGEKIDSEGLPTFEVVQGTLSSTILGRVEFEEEADDYIRIHPRLKYKNEAVVKELQQAISNKYNKVVKWYGAENTKPIVPKPITPIQEIYYENLGIQLDIAPKVKEKLIFGSQTRKLVFSNLFGETVKPEFERLAKEYNQLVDKLVQYEFKKLTNSLGIKVGPNGELGFNGNYKKLVSQLRESLEDKDTADNIIDSLQTNDDGSLKYPIDSMVNRPKIESMLFSIVNSRVIKQKMNGNSLVQLASSGFEKAGKREVGKSNYLAFYTNKGKNGTTTAMEVEIPMNKNFKPLLDKYGSIDAVNDAITSGKIDAKDLTMIGYRIPTQGLNSMDVMTIKRFMPSESGIAIILPTGVVAKSGGDYDIDKLNIFMPHLGVEKKDSKEGMQNRIVEIMSEVLTHPDNFIDLTTPNTTDTLTNLVAKIRVAQGKSTKIEKASMTREFRFDFIMEQFTYFLGGKAALGIAATHNTHHILSQIAKVKLNANIPFKHNSTGGSNSKPTYKGNLDRNNLPEDGVFVFGSNPIGINGNPANGTGGAALVAHTEFGVKQGEKMDNKLSNSGRAYGLTTVNAPKNYRTPLEIKESINKLYNYAEANPSKKFYIAYSGENADKKNLNGLTSREIAKLFNESSIPTNIIFEEKFDSLVRDGIIKQVDLGGITTKGGQKISDLISQFINAYVDVAKDPFYKDLNAGTEVTSVWMYLIRAGVDVNTIGYFMTQPIIQEYVAARKLNNSLVVTSNNKKNSTGFISEKKQLELDADLTFINYEIEKLEKKSSLTGKEKAELAQLKLDSSRIEASMTSIASQLLDKYGYEKEQDGVTDYAGDGINDKLLKWIAEGSKVKDGKYSREFRLAQSKMLRMFLEFEKQAGELTTLMQDTNNDTTKLQNYGSIYKRSLVASKVENSSVIPVGTSNRIKQNTIVGSFDLSDKISRMYSELTLYTSKPQIKIAIDNLLNGIDSKADFAKEYAKIQNSLIGFITQKFGKTIEGEPLFSKMSLLSGDNSLAKQLVNIRKEGLVESNPFLDELVAQINGDTKAIDTIKLYSRRMGAFESNIYTEAFRELINSNDPRVAAFGRDLAYITILQSGLQNSPITFTELIPFEFYGNIVKGAINRADELDVEDFIKGYYHNVENGSYKIQDFGLSDSPTVTKEQETLPQQTDSVVDSNSIENDDFIVSRKYNEYGAIEDSITEKATGTTLLRLTTKSGNVQDVVEQNINSKETTQQVVSRFSNSPSFRAIMNIRSMNRLEESSDNNKQCNI